MLNSVKSIIQTIIHNSNSILVIVLLISIPTTKALAKSTKNKILFSGVFATGFKGGTYESIANTLNKNPEISFKVINTKGSSHIIKKVASGTAQIGIAQLDSLFSMYKSKKYYRQNVRILLPLYLEELHILARKSISSVKELKGKKISLGAKGSGSHNTGKNLLKAFDINQKNTHFEFYDMEKSIKYLQTKKIDALFLVSGQPVRVLQELPQSFGNNIHLISIPSNMFKKVSDIYFHYQSTLISKNSYKWQSRNVQTIGVISALIGQKTLRFKDISTILKPLLTSTGKFQNIHPKMKKLNLQTVVYYLAGKSEMFHPSTIVYLKSSGILK